MAAIHIDRYHCRWPITVVKRVQVFLFVSLVLTLMSNLHEPSSRVECSTLIGSPGSSFTLPLAASSTSSPPPTRNGSRIDDPLASLFTARGGHDADSLLPPRTLTNQSDTDAGDYENDGHSLLPTTSSGVLNITTLTSKAPSSTSFEPAWSASVPSSSSSPSLHNTFLLLCQTHSLRYWSLDCPVHSSADLHRLERSIELKHGFSGFTLWRPSTSVSPYSEYLPERERSKYELIWYDLHEQALHHAPLRRNALPGNEIFDESSCDQLLSIGANATFSFKNETRWQTSNESIGTEPRLEDDRPPPVKEIAVKLVMDNRRQMLFMLNYNHHRINVYRVDMSGNQVAPIGYVHTLSPFSIAIDARRELVVWIENFDRICQLHYGRALARVDLRSLNLTESKRCARVPSALALTLNTDRGRVYWSNKASEVRDESYEELARAASLSADEPLSGRLVYRSSIASLIRMEYWNGFLFLNDGVKRNVRMVDLASNASRVVLIESNSIFDIMMVDLSGLKQASTQSTMMMGSTLPQATTRTTTKLPSSIFATTALELNATIRELELANKSTARSSTFMAASTTASSWFTVFNATKTSSVSADNAKTNISFHSIFSSSKATTLINLEDFQTPPSAPFQVTARFCLYLFLSMAGSILLLAVVFCLLWRRGGDVHPPSSPLLRDNNLRQRWSKLAASGFGVNRLLGSVRAWTFGGRKQNDCYDRLLDSHGPQMNDCLASNSSSACCHIDCSPSRAQPTSSSSFFRANLRNSSQAPGLSTSSVAHLVDIEDIMADDQTMTSRKRCPSVSLGRQRSVSSSATSSNDLCDEDDARRVAAVQQLLRPCLACPDVEMCSEKGVCMSTYRVQAC